MTGEFRLTQAQADGLALRMRADDLGVSLEEAEEIGFRELIESLHGSLSSAAAHDEVEPVEVDPIELQP